MNIYETLYENYIVFEKNTISVIIDNTDKLWFNGNELTKAIGYIDSKDAIRKHTDKTDKIQLKDINHSTEIKQHPHSIYISEGGLYKLVLRSKMKNTKKFSDWITNDVLPSIRKHGYYKLKKIYENDKSELLEKIQYLEKQNKLMKNDMKKEKYPDGALVYILDYSYDDTKLDRIYRLGSTDDMNKRKKIYDTHTLYKRQVIIKEFTDKPLQLETCVRSMLYDYRYKNKKDYYICKLNVIEKAFKNCIKSIKNMSIVQKGGYLSDINLLKLKLKRLDNKLIKLNVII